MDLVNREMNHRNGLVIIALALGFLLLWQMSQSTAPPVQPPQIQQPPPEPITPVPPEPEPPSEYTITPYPQEYPDYQGIVTILKKWNQEAPEITEFGVYGKTKNGTDCTYLRVGTPGKPQILFHAAIHGNERLSTGATMFMLGKMLHEYGRNEDITWLVKNREIYWVPCLSPDTYLKSRYVEGVDPNRDYPHPRRANHASASPIQAIRDFVEKMDFKGVISGHTYGSVYLWPSLGGSGDQGTHRKLAEEMSTISRYSNSRISGSPNGYEIDWYYWKGAVAILTEFGTGSHSPPTSAIPEHGGRNYGAYMLFAKKAPDLKIYPPEDAKQCPFYVVDPLSPEYLREE